MNILFIPNKDPRLRNGGSEQRTNLLWESLKRYGTVYTLLEDWKLADSPELIDGEHPIYKYHPQGIRYSLWRFMVSVLCRLTSFSIYEGKLLKAVNPKDVFQGVHFDIVVTRYIYPLCHYKYWELAPLLIDIDDHPYQVYKTEHENKLPFWLKDLGKFFTEWQTKYILNKSIGGWIANQEQLEYCVKNYHFLPNIPQHPSDNYNECCSERKYLFTVGVMSYVPNKKGVTIFLNQVWPSFHRKHPDVQYYIVGKGASESDVLLWNSFEGVKYLGFVEDLEELYEKSLATVVPVYSGGGTCIKTLEAMAYSRPCISTKFGARGLSEDVIQQEKGLLLFNDSETFIKAYEKLQSPNVRRDIEVQGRNLILSHYSVDCFNNAVDEVINKVIPKE